MQTLAQEIQKRMTYLLPAGITEKEWEAIVDQIIVFRQEAVHSELKLQRERIKEELMEKWERQMLNLDETSLKNMQTTILQGRQESYKN